MVGSDDLPGPQTRQIYFFVPRTMQARNLSVELDRPEEPHADGIARQDNSMKWLCDARLRMAVCTGRASLVGYKRC